MLLAPPLRHEEPEAISIDIDYNRLGSDHTAIQAFRETYPEFDQLFKLFEGDERKGCGPNAAAKSSLPPFDVELQDARATRKWKNRLVSHSQIFPKESP